MSNGEQLTFDFEAPDASAAETQPDTNAMAETCTAQSSQARDKSHLVLVVNQSTPLARRNILEPNSPEVTRMIRSAASVIGW